MLNDPWYTDFVRGQNIEKRHEHRKCNKKKLQKLDMTVVLVSQVIISGSDRYFLGERINGPIDEAYSRGISRFVT